MAAIGGICVNVDEGHVVRWQDPAGNKRPVIVLQIRENGTIVLLEGTKQEHWKDDGERVIMEVRGGRIAKRMGLRTDITTYFYGSRRRLHLVTGDQVLVGHRVYTCPDENLRQMQSWAFGILEGERGEPQAERRHEVNQQTAQVADE